MTGNTRGEPVSLDCSRIRKDPGELARFPANSQGSRRTRTDPGELARVPANSRSGFLTLIAGRLVIPYIVFTSVANDPARNVANNPARYPVFSLTTVAGPVAGSNAPVIPQGFRIRGITLKSCCRKTSDRTQSVSPTCVFGLWGSYVFRLRKLTSKSCVGQIAGCIAPRE